MFLLVCLRHTTQEKHVNLKNTVIPAQAEIQCLLDMILTALICCHPERSEAEPKDLKCLGMLDQDPSVSLRYTQDDIVRLTGHQ